MEKKNCWEVRNCGREPGGHNVGDLGLCAAATTKIMDGVHGGENAGRACWIVVGSKCGNETISAAEKRRTTCMACDFYHMVQLQEGNNLKHTEELFNLIG